MIQRCFVGLGSNLGARAEALGEAVRSLNALPGATLVAASSLYETPPSGHRGGAFLNAAVELMWSGTARSLLDALLALEGAAGRGPRRAAPRALDLDLLFFGVEVIREPGLTVPHPRIPHRPFVLVPMVELAPTWRHPVGGATMFRLLRDYPDLSEIRFVSGPEVLLGET